LFELAATNCSADSASTSFAFFKTNIPAASELACVFVMALMMEVSIIKILWVDKYISAWIVNSLARRHWLTTAKITQGNFPLPEDKGEKSILI
jgi:hypothetical protein